MEEEAFLVLSKIIMLLPSIAPEESSGWTEALHLFPVWEESR